MRDALGLDTRIVGVVSTEADAARRAFETGTAGETDSAQIEIGDDENVFQDIAE